MIQGVYTAVITPFLDNQEIDIEGFKANLKHQIDGGVSGVVIFGTTGESPTITYEERDILIQTAVELCKGKIAIWVGTGSYSTKITIKLTLRAKELGADGALVVTPYYNKPTQEGLYQHFKALAEATDFPIMVYNIQGRTGVNLETATLRRLMDIPQIIAVKEASGNINQIMDVIAEKRPGFAVLSGDDALTLPIIALGGIGVVSVLSNLVPSDVNALTQAALGGNFEKAREMHFRLLPLMKIAFIETNPGPIKALMSLSGLAAGSLRLPMVPVSSYNHEKLQQCLNETLQLQP